MDRTPLNAWETQEQQSSPSDFSWPFWFVVPLYPYGKRRTLRKEVVKDTIWTFDQMQGILYAVVPICMTVVKLAEGGLLVYAPVAATPECIRLVKELVAQHGDVKYIIQEDFEFLIELEESLSKLGITTPPKEKV